MEFSHLAFEIKTEDQMTFWMNLSSAGSFYKSRKGRLRRYHLFYAYHTPVPSTLSRTNKTAKGPLYCLLPAPQEGRHRGLHLPTSVESICVQDRVLQNSCEHSSHVYMERQDPPQSQLGCIHPGSDGRLRCGVAAVTMRAGLHFSMAGQSWDGLRKAWDRAGAWSHSRSGRAGSQCHSLCHRPP